jgi:predicted  nucleic acid-binding Zn-ribbon protein
MFKNLISPIQAWLLSQSRCVGCGEELSKGTKKTVNGKDIVNCRCGRAFIYKNNTFRRAMFDEV